MMNKVAKLFFGVILLLSYKTGYAQDVSTSEAIDQIQKTLLFSDKDSAVKKSQQRKSAVNIDRSGDKLSASKIEIIAVDPTQKNQQAEQKEKLAYNAAVAGQYEVAVELYKQILKSNSKNNYAKFALATCYHKLGQYSQAKTLYYQLLKADDENQSRDEIIGNLLEVIIEESPNDALYLLSNLSAQNPNSARILASSAMAFDKVGRTDQAILLLSRAINVDQSEIKYKFNLAVIYDKTGDAGNALTFYRDVIDNYTKSDNPDNSIPVTQIKQRVEFLNSQPTS